MPEPIDLERELRAIAPRPRPEFRANLDTQVAQGFPRPARGWRLPRLQILVPALGTGLAAVLAVAVVLGTRGGSDDATTSSPGVAVQRESAAPAPQADSGAAAHRAGPGGRAAASSAPRAWSSAPAPGASRRSPTASCARRSGSAGSSRRRRSAATAGGGTATFTLRIPAARLDDAMAELSRLGTVRSIEGSTQDLTGHLRRHELAARGRTDAAQGDRREARDRVGRRGRPAADPARGRDRGGRAPRAPAARAARPDDLRDRRPDRRSAPASGAVTPPADGPWTPGDAWRDARRGLEVAAGDPHRGRELRGAAGRCSRGSPCGCGGAGATPCSTRCRRSSCSRRRSAARRR